MKRIVTTTGPDAETSRPTDPRTRRKSGGIARHPRLNLYLNLGLTHINPENPLRISGQSSLLRVNTGQRALLYFLQPNTGYELLPAIGEVMRRTTPRFTNASTQSGRAGRSRSIQPSLRVTI